MSLNPEGRHSSAPAGALQPWATRSTGLWCDCISTSPTAAQIPLAGLGSSQQLLGIITPPTSKPKENKAAVAVTIIVHALLTKTRWHKATA
jgi:hypothetical protein